MLTVKEIFEFDSLKKAKLIAGKNKIDNIIESVTVLEATTEEVLNWVKENELLLTSFYAIADNIESQINVIEMLNKKKCSGIIICSLGYWIKDLSPRVIKRSEELNFPLIVLSPETSYYEVINDVMKVLLDYNSEKLELALKIQSEMHALMKFNKNIEELLKCLTFSFKKEIIFIDIDNKISFESSRLGKNKKEKIYENIKKILNNDLNEIPKEVYVEEELYIPMISFGNYYGTLVVLGVSDYEKEKISLAATHACTTMMIIKDNNRKIKYNDNHKLKIFLDRLIENKYKNEYEIYEAAGDLDFDLSNIEYIATIILNYDKNTYTAIEILKNIIMDDNLGNKIIIKGNALTILLSKNSKNLNDRINLIFKKIKNSILNKDTKLKIGLSEKINKITEIKDKCNQSTTAIKIGEIVFKSKTIIYYNELGFYGLLENLDTKNFVFKKIEKKIKILYEYDKKNNMEYYKTFIALIKKDESYDEVSNDLHIHKNTLLYRKKRIIGLLGDNPFVFPDKINYQMFIIKKELESSTDELFEDKDDF